MHHPVESSPLLGDEVIEVSGNETGVVFLVRLLVALEACEARPTRQDGLQIGCGHLPGLVSSWRTLEI